MQDHRFKDVLALARARHDRGEPLDWELLARERPDCRPAIEEVRGLWDLMSHGGAQAGPKQSLVSPSDGALERSASLSRASAELRQGLRLGKYELERTLGRGGQGVVWLARDSVMGVDVALKFLPEWLTADEKAMRDLRDEARTLSTLKHEHIVRSNTLEKDGSLLFLSLEYLKGPTLLDVLEERQRARVGALLPEEVLRVLEQVAPAVDYAHAHGVLHKDLKPANLMLTAMPEKSLHLESPEDVKVVVTDFGLSYRIRTSGSKSRSADYRAGGTPAYMAPEVLKDEQPTPRTDVYSLGATLYHLLCGAPPFGGSDVFRRILEEPPPLLSSEQIPHAFRAVVLECLAKDPAKRPATCAEVLRRIVHAPPPAREPAIPVLGGPWGRLRRAILPSRRGRLLEGCRAIDARAGADGHARRIHDDRSGIEFQLIEAGSFRRGSARDVGLKHEEPRHSVTIQRPFYLAATPVTVGQWRTFVQLGAHATQAEREGNGVTIHREGRWVTSSKANWRNPLPMLECERPENLPVTVVSWHDAQDFCRRYHYRLPTEAEWEYACRATTEYRYWWGDDPRGGKGHGNFADAAFLREFPRFDLRRKSDRESAFPFDDRWPYTSPVGLFRQNPWGLCDMLGNVWEWCQDCYDPSAYQDQVPHDPLVTVGAQRVLRGGSFADGVDSGRCAFRWHAGPDWRSAHVGFRPVIQL